MALADPQTYWEWTQLRKLRELLDASATLKSSREELSPSSYDEQASELRQQFAVWQTVNEMTLEYPDVGGHEHAEFLKLVRHVTKHDEEWLRFLDHAEVDRTNNLAERQIRRGVITRKVGGCNQSDSGAWKTSVLSSLIASCAQQSKSYLSLVKQRLHSRAPTAISLSTLPACG